MDLIKPFRPPKRETRKIMLYCDPTLDEELRRIAYDEKCSLNVILRASINLWLKQYKKQKSNGLESSD